MDRRRPPASSTERVLLGAVERAGSAIHGYVLDPEREGEALVVELLLDGLPYDILRAELFDPMLAAEGARNPYHGFRFVLPASLAERAVTAEIRLANDGTLIGGGLSIDGQAGTVTGALPAGSVAWLGGLRFGGWLAPSGVGEMLLRGLIDENAVVEARPQGWTMVEWGGASLAVPAFEFQVPARFADGRAHRLEVVTGAGHALPPGPVPFVAFEDGLASFLARHTDVEAERLRGAFYDRVIPQSLPFDALEGWMRRFGPPPAAPHAKPVAVVLIGDALLEASLDSLQEQRDLWIAGVMSFRGEAADFEPGDLVAFLEAEAAECEAVVFAAGGTVFLPGALQRLAEPLLADGAGDCAYADIIAGDAETGRDLPLALPAFDRERMIEQGYAAGLFALSRAAALAAAREGANSLFRLFLSGSGVGGPARRVPLHLPGFLARVARPADGRAAASLLEAARHLCDTLHIQGRIEPVAGARLHPALRLRRRPAHCLVSAVVVARNDADDLRRCILALRAQETVQDLEFIVVDNDSSTAEMTDLLAQIASDGVQIVRVRGPRNVARSMNCGAAIASGAYLCFLDQHVALSSPDAIDEMLSRCSSQGTGAVGGLLTWPGGAIHDGGLVLNFKEGATAAFRGLGAEDAGYGEHLLTAREVSAVSGAFMMSGRDTFLAAGGMDEVLFPQVFPAVAFCLANAALGQRTVFTPYARAVWHGAPEDGERGARFDRELAHLRAAWPDLLAGDPAYSPLLNLDGRLHSGLAWPPRGWAPRRPAAAPRGAEGPGGADEPSPGGPGRRRPQGEQR